ncbi:hypothetical protein OPHB3_2842 [Oceanobacillus picturae]|uniref:DUF1569 domain-containing protein n=1 Tax=Oceanobacillus picturae TaxID=171693 RepID=A0A0U9HGG4_9BACI|nr:hypothetical protein OPHB3_2842 [Oceanobacillus picturae]
MKLTHTDEILERIENLKINSEPQWGKMDVSQMLDHCSSFQDIAMGYSLPPRGWLGVLVGRFAKPIFYNDKPLAHNMSTIPSILITSKKDFEIERDKLKQKIITFQKNGPDACTSHAHPFFGNLTSEQWGKGIYKHLDHH